MSVNLRLFCIALVATLSGVTAHAQTRLPRIEAEAPNYLGQPPAYNDYQFMAPPAQPVSLVGYSVAGCSDDGLACAAPCDSITSCTECCEQPVWSHRSSLFGEFLYLRPRNAEVAYAVPADG